MDPALLNDEIASYVSALEKPAEPEKAAAPPDAPPPENDPEPVEAVTHRASTQDLDELLDAIGETNARMAPLRTGCSTVERLLG